MFTYQTPTRHALLAHEKRHLCLKVAHSSDAVVLALHGPRMYSGVRIRFSHCDAVAFERDVCYFDPGIKSSRYGRFN